MKKKKKEQGVKRKSLLKKHQKSLSKMIDFLHRNRERVILVVVALFFLLFIGIGILLQQIHVEEAQKERAPDKPEKVQLQTRNQTSDTKGKGQQKNNRNGESSFFYLKPSPEELLNTLQEMQHLRSDVAQEKLQNMRVLWPLYFFEIRKSLEKTEEVRTGPWVAVFDVSKDGFGVMVEAEYKSDQFPELEALETGKKLWVGGKIIGVDPLGTGRVRLKIEYIDFSFGIPLSARAGSAPQSESGIEKAKTEEKSVK